MVKRYKFFLFVLEAEWNGLKGELFYVYVLSLIFNFKITNAQFIDATI